METNTTPIHSTKFLGLTIDTSLSWKYIEEIKSKLNKACYAIQSFKPFMSLEVLKMTYFSYVHSVLSYGIIFWGNSSYSKNILKFQIRIIWVIMSSVRRDSCHELFRQLNILLLHSQYIVSLLLFIIKNGDHFLSNEIRDINTRYNFHLHLSLENLTLYQKGVFFAGSWIFNHLLSIIKDLSNYGKCFKTAVKRYFLGISFYSLVEYFNQNLL